MIMQVSSTRSLALAMRVAWRPGNTRVPGAVPPTAEEPRVEREDGHRDRGDVRRVDGRHHYPGRKFLQRSLHRLEKAVAGRIRDALRDSDLSREDRRRIGRLLKEFHHDLKDVLHDAADHGRLDPAALEQGIGAAVERLTEGLRAVLDAAGLPPAETPGGSDTAPTAPPTDHTPLVTVEFAAQLVVTGSVSFYA